MVSYGSGFGNSSDQYLLARSIASSRLLTANTRRQHWLILLCSTEEPLGLL